MAKILICAPTQNMVEQAEKAISRMEVDAHVELTRSDNILDIVSREKANGAIVTIARGYQAQMIKKQMQDMPLVEIVLSGQNLAVLLDQAKALYQDKEPLVGLVGFPNMFSDTEPLEKVMRLKLRTYFMNLRDETPDVIAQAKRDGVDVIIGGEAACACADAQGIKTVFMKSTPDCLVTAIKAAKQVVYAIELEKRHSATFSTLLDYSMDVVLHLESSGRILYANYMAEKVFHLSSKVLQSKNISSLLDLAASEHPINVAMREKKSVYGCTVRTSTEALMANLAAIHSESGEATFILAMQNFKKIEKMEETIRQSSMNAANHASFTFENLKTQSPAMVEVRNLAKCYARYDLPILLTGEGGTGKHQLAECIHNFSLRNDRNFVVVDCGGLTPEMQQRRLMGQDERFENRGAFYQAHTGTLLLENVDMLCTVCQHQLLQLLRSHYIMSGNGRTMLPVDIRVICSTTKNLYRCVHDGTFLDSLYSRLSQLELKLPPLSQRPEDLPALLDENIETFSAKYHKYVTLTAEARRLIYACCWSGNIEQLSLFCEKMVILAESQTISEEDVRRLLSGIESMTGACMIQTHPEQPVVIVNSSEAADIIAVMRRFSGNRQAVADALGISKTTLWRKMKKYGIDKMIE